MSATIEVVRMIANSKEPDGSRLLDKTVAAAIGVSPGQFSRKVAMKGESKFSVEELGALADYFRAPPGWPFITLELAQQLYRTPEIATPTHK